MELQRSVGPRTTNTIYSQQLPGAFRQAQCEPALPKGGSTSRIHTNYMYGVHSGSCFAEPAEGRGAGELVKAGRGKVLGPSRNPARREEYSVQVGK